MTVSRLRPQPNPTQQTISNLSNSNAQLRKQITAMKAGKIDKTTAIGIGVLVSAAAFTAGYFIGSPTAFNNVVATITPAADGAVMNAFNSIKALFVKG